MGKLRDILRGAGIFFAYTIPAACFVWRADCYDDAPAMIPGGHGLLLGRCMLIVLALLLALTGLTRSLQALDQDA
jgi:hypothetical protein